MNVEGHLSGPKSPLFAAISPAQAPKRFLPQKKVGRNASHAPPLGSVSFVLSPMSTWLEQNPIKIRWQPLPCQIALLPTRILKISARGTQKISAPYFATIAYDSLFPRRRQGLSLDVNSAIFYFICTIAPMALTTNERPVKPKTTS
jgi:hypothetical protein